MNLVILCGRLTAEPKLTYGTNNSEMAICKYALAIDRGYGEKKKTIFVNCTAFGKAGEFASKYFHKGQRVLIQGELDISSNEEKTKQYVNVIISNQEFADGKPGTNEKAPDINGFEDASGEDTIPF